MAERPEDTSDKLSSDLLRDFYQTFRLSQGDAAIQPPLFARLAEQHHAIGTTALLPSAIQSAGKKVHKLMTPARHADIDPNTPNLQSSGFDAMWYDFSEILSGPSTDRYRRDEYVLEDMLARDEYYQGEPRPNCTGNADPHESIVREYIVGDQLTGSEQLLRVRGQLRRSLIHPSNDDGGYMMKRLEAVTEKWEMNHPGQTY